MPEVLVSKTQDAMSCCENFARYRGHLGLSGPKVANRVRKRVPGPLGFSTQKSPKQSRKRVKIDDFSTILTLFQLRSGLFGPRGQEGRGTHFATLFATLGPRAQMTPVAGPRNPKCHVIISGVLLGTFGRKKLHHVRDASC